MVSYVQSRGRARKKVSTFVVMVPEGQEDQLAKYLSMKNSEDHITHFYRTRHLEIDDNEEDDSGDEEYSLDLVNRERYVVESTGAVLSYDNALHLLGLLCSQIPCDPFTPAHKPKFRGEFQSTLHLPWALPLRPEYLIFHGPRRHTKKEARRAVAFEAVRQLRELDVFDEYLLPISTKEVSEDGSSYTGSPSKVARNAPPMMSVLTRDPWCIGQRLWLHRVTIDGMAVAGLVTGTRLPPVEVVTQARRVAITCGEQLSFEETLEHHQRRLMEDFTKLCIFYNVTASPFTSRLSLYLIPITEKMVPDFSAMENLVSNPWGCSDWSRISEKDYDRLILVCLPRFGSVKLLHRIRNDLTPMSKPDAGSRESAFSTYHDYWQKSWTTKRRVPIIATEGPIIETQRVPRSNVGSYNLHPSDEEVKPVSATPDDRLLPQANCGWIPISHALREAYRVLPTLCFRITHVCRAQYARLELSLPAIQDDLLIEALTIPSATFSFNNQRLETLGDAVLQVCTTVHLFHQYPNRHEGQLTKLRHEYVSNRYLLQRALDLGLERYIICETPIANKWRYLLSDQDDSGLDGIAVPSRYVLREFPRRSLQDCMEAILGASFLAGGINMLCRRERV
jgi:endoribonuclease Dicer